jgi:hypothetical protein
MKLRSAPTIFILALLLPATVKSMAQGSAIDSVMYSEKSNNLLKLDYSDEEGNTFYSIYGLGENQRHETVMITNDSAYLLVEKESGFTVNGYFFRIVYSLDDFMQKYRFSKQRQKVKELTVKIRCVDKVITYRKTTCPEKSQFVSGIIVIEVMSASEGKIIYQDSLDFDLLIPLGSDSNFISNQQLSESVTSSITISSSTSQNDKIYSFQLCFNLMFETGNECYYQKNKKVERNEFMLTQWSCVNVVFNSN